MDTSNLETEYKEKGCWGLVASIDIYGCDPLLVSDKEKIRALIVDLVDHIGMVRYGEPMIERFAEGALEGCSALQFIETSSITMHFDEGQNRAFIDIFSCKFFDHQAAEKFCREWLKGSSSKSNYLLRH
jgi:S-adenosylmethionine decarboxylase